MRKKYGCIRGCQRIFKAPCEILTEQKLCKYLRFSIQKFYISLMLHEDLHFKGKVYFMFFLVFLVRCSVLLKAILFVLILQFIWLNLVFTFRL